MLRLLVLLGSMLAVLTVPALALEPNVDRPGQDYNSFDIQPNPAICEQACMSQPQCRAWTYVVPGVQGPSARCWLKSGVPAAQANACCTSGTKPVTPIAVGPGLESNIDRPGQDYYNFDIQPNPAACQQACQGDPKCRAWTYVVPGVQGPSARCWLKHAVPAAVASDCCVSGTKEQLRNTGTFRSRWDWAGGPNQGYTTGWVPGHPRQVCGHYAAGCSGCGGADYCGEHPNGALVGWWPNGVCGPHQTVLRCTSEPE